MRYPAYLETVVEFFATLANTERLEDLSTEEKEQGALRLVPIFAQGGELAAMEEYRRLGIPPAVPKGLDTLLPYTHHRARTVIGTLLDRGMVMIPSQDLPGVCLLRAGRTVREAPYHGSRRSWIEGALYQVCRTSPFPFGRCSVCTRVFVQPRRGKPRKYCSAACKAKRPIPRDKQTAYHRAWLDRTRKQELLTARRILRTSPKAEQFSKLREAFPKKTFRQLLYLKKRAESKHSVSRRGRKEN